MKKPAPGHERSHAVVAGLLLLLVFASCASAQAPDPSAPAPAMLSSLQSEQFRTLVDPFFADRMEKGHIPGAVFVLVKDGQVLFEKGYGFADLETRRPMDPERTIVRAGSISKLLTATAVMQLYERHLVSLDENVNSYLKRLTLEDAFPQPVTLANLLTHTAGLAEHIHGQHQLNASKVLPLAEYLARRMPPRVMPPGQLFSYNDHGMSLAGLVVQEVSGIPFAEYVRTNIFQPLGMERSTFEQRPNSSQMKDLATGYGLRDGRNVAYQLDYVHTVPSAGLYTTARDVSRFMIAQLQYGRLGEARILNEPTAREMQARHFAHHPRLRGRAYGFSELFINGQRIIFHDGGMPGFTSRLGLLPEHGLGFFVSYTSDRLGLKSDLTAILMKALFPAAGAPASTAPAAATPEPAFPAAVTPPPAPPAAAARDLSAFAGYYDQVAGFSTNALRLGSMLENYTTVEAAGIGALKMFGVEFQAVDPVLFRDKDGEFVAFGRDARQQVRYLFVGTGAYEKLGVLDTPSALLSLASVIALASLPLGVVWPLAALAWPSRFRTSWRRQLPAGKNLAGATSFLILFFVVAFVGLFLQIEHYWQIMRNEFPWPWITRLLVVPLIITALSPFLIVATARAWVRRSGTVLGRSCMSLAAAATVLFVAALWHWNLIGFNY